MAGKPQTPGTPTTTAPNALDAAVARVRNSDDFPALVGRVHQLMAVLGAEDASVMMGAESVRDLATTIVVWEHFRRRSPGLRPLLMLSLLCANHARELAE